MDPPMPYPALLTQILHQPDKVVADIPAIADLTALSASLDGLKASYGRRLAAVQSGKRQVGARRAAELEHEMRVARAEEARIAAREKAEREKVEGEERERKERKEREREREKEERERVAVVAEQQRVKKEAAATAKAEAETKSRLEKQQQQQQQKQQQQMQKKTLPGGGSAPPATSVKQEENEAGPSQARGSSAQPLRQQRQASHPASDDSDASSVAIASQLNNKKKRKRGMITSDGEEASTTGSRPRSNSRSVSRQPGPAPAPEGSRQSSTGPGQLPKIKLFTSNRALSPLPAAQSTPSDIDFRLPLTASRSLVPLRPPIPTPPIPGPMRQKDVNEDFTGAKPAGTQIVFSSFWQGVEPYVRQIGEEDLAFLKAYKDEDAEPYVVPPLGRHYTELWTEEDRLGGPSLIGSSISPSRAPPSAANAPAPPANRVLDYPRMTRAEGGFDASELREEDLVLEERSAGPLTERVVSALLAARTVGDGPLGFETTTVPGGGGSTDGQTGAAAEGGEGAGISGAESREQATTTPATTMTTTAASMTVEEPPKVGLGELEENMRRELQFVGLLGDDEIDWAQRADDEISTSLRQTQRLLAEQSSLNESRRSVLLGIARDRLAYAEYQQCLDGLDRVIDHAWQKRQRAAQKAAKRKEKGRSGTSSVADKEKEEREREQGKALGEVLKKAMDNRRKLVDHVGGFFRQEEKGRFFGLPDRSVFGRENEQQQEIAAAGVGVDEPMDG